MNQRKAGSQLMKLVPGGEQGAGCRIFWAYSGSELVQYLREEGSSHGAQL